MKGRLVRREDVNEQAAMLALLQEYFVGVTGEQFERDLAEKNWVILLEDAGVLRGFSTLLVHDGVVHSGDTIVHRDAWGSTALARTWLETIRELKPEYWLLITSGFRTYRFLPVFWKEFWPRHDAPVRPALLETLARQRFGSLYRDGLVHFHQPQMLRNGLKEIPSGRLADPHIQFFAQQNPGHASGDELVCLCPLTAANQTAAGRRLVAL
ncbi:MAG: hypothetical protein PCFJNLEI_03917 [Verrucomicrobiae bacterium]|nr:hypothetical protein [Verrucomicrobiae bacterium]